MMHQVVVVGVCTKGEKKDIPNIPKKVLSRWFTWPPCLDFEIYTILIVNYTQIMLDDIIDSGQTSTMKTEW